jgi:hypothetical protein
MGTAMLKAISAIISAAAIAAVITFILPGAPVDAGPLDKPAEATLKQCTQQAWPYLNCVGTSIGNPKIRLVTTDRIAQ